MTYGVRDWAPDRPLDELHRTLSGVGFDTELSADITGEMWAKWVFIASIAAVNCLARGAIGEVAGAPGGIRFAEAVVAEGAAVAEAAGYPLLEAAAAIARGAVTAQGSVATASLYRDLTSGQRVEVEQIFGDLVDRANELSVPVPLLEVVTLQLRVYQHRLDAGSS
jgi:2-dehydropantoate 2-reductase